MCLASLVGLRRIREWRGGELVAEARRSWFRVATRLVRRSLPEALQCAEGLVLVGGLALLLFLYCLHTYVRVVEWAACRGEATSPSGMPTAVAPPSPPAAPVVTPSSSSSKLATFMASVPQQKSLQMPSENGLLSMTFYLLLLA